MKIAVNRKVYCFFFERAQVSVFFSCPETRKGGIALAKYQVTKFKKEDSTYNKDLADYAVSFIECLSHTKGTWAGKPFKLLAWQEQIIRDLLDQGKEMNLHQG